MKRGILLEAHFGAGPAINFFVGNDGPGRGDNFNLLVGLAHDDGFFTDVKVTPEGKVKILDFGLAKAFEGFASKSHQSAREVH